MNISLLYADGVTQFLDNNTTAQIKFYDQIKDVLPETLEIKIGDDDHPRNDFSPNIKNNLFKAKKGIYEF